jgi:AmiR/NasT family two-component response regulator
MVGGEGLETYLWELEQALAQSATREIDQTQLAEALETCKVIGLAQGILVERESCTRQEAFQMLKAASQHSHVNLREIAADFVAAAEKASRSKAG